MGKQTSDWTSKLTSKQVDKWVAPSQLKHWAIQPVHLEWRRQMLARDWSQIWNMINFSFRRELATDWSCVIEPYPILDSVAPCWQPDRQWSMICLPQNFKKWQSGRRWLTMLTMGHQFRDTPFIFHLLLFFFSFWGSWSLNDSMASLQSLSDEIATKK